MDFFYGILLFFHQYSKKLNYPQPAAMPKKLMMRHKDILSSLWFIILSLSYIFQEGFTFSLNCFSYHPWPFLFNLRHSPIVISATFMRPNNMQMPDRELGMYIVGLLHK